VFVDIDPQTFNMDVARLKLQSPQTSHSSCTFIWLDCRMDAIMAIADKHHLTVIEDACQSHAAEFKGKRAGSFGTGTFSLYPTKNMTSAEGGMITTYDDAIAEKCKVLRNHGMRRRYYHDELGYNFRMTDVHAAIGNAQLGKLDTLNARRAQNAGFYNANLKGVTTPLYLRGISMCTIIHTRVPNGKRDTCVNT
jgi:dTDP-4-amino-4,6-dideoxygalactose transaminase